MAPGIEKVMPNIRTVKIAMIGAQNPHKIRTNGSARHSMEQTASPTQRIVLETSYTECSVAFLGTFPANAWVIHSGSNYIGK